MISLIGFFYGMGVYVLFLLLVGICIFTMVVSIVIWMELYRRKHRLDKYVDKEKTREVMLIYGGNDLVFKDEVLAVFDRKGVANGNQINNARIPHLKPVN